MKKETKNALKNIVELIEDKNFPARRNITDYILFLLPFDEREETEQFINELYNDYDKSTKKTH